MGVRSKVSTCIAFAASTFWFVRHVRSEAVLKWSPTRLPGARYGVLYARSGGPASSADGVILLHGLVSSGEIFGESFDQLGDDRRLVVPDLLGFGESLDETRSSFLLSDHLDALDDLAEQTGMFECDRVTIGAHSMGSAVALAWAARHKDRVVRVVCWGAPVYESPEAARERVSGSVMTRLFVLDTKWAKKACALSCRNRTAAGWLTALSEPDLPIAVARAVSRHTWPAYSDAIRGLVMEADWAKLTHRAAEAGIRVEFVYGSDDPIGDKDYVRELALPLRNVGTRIIPGVDHRLPMTDPLICIEHLGQADRD